LKVFDKALIWIVIIHRDPNIYKVPPKFGS
jgi:hypothetical protein